MQFIKDLFTGILKHIDTRISSPVIGAFSFSFIFINWDHFVLLIFGSSSIEKRVEDFKAFFNAIDTKSILLPIIITVLYLFLLPVINYVVSLIQGSIEHFRYASAINQKIRKEKERGKLINSTYKAENQNKIAEQEIEEEVALSKEKIEQEKAISEKVRVSSKYAIEIIQHLYDKSKDVKIELDTKIKNNEAQGIKLQKERLAYEREKLQQEKIKLDVEEKRKLSQLPSAFMILDIVNHSMINDGVKLSLTGLYRIISSVFGYSSFSKLLEDNDFNMNTLEKVDYIIYSDGLVNEIISVLEDENINDFEQEYIFEHIQSVFEENLSIKIFTQERIGEDIRDKLEMDGLYDLISSEEISGSIAETNAYFDSVDDLQIKDYRLEKTVYEVDFQCVISGTTHEDKPFSGDEIDVTFVNRSDVLLGCYSYRL
ncbi:hypothetical protein RHD99_01375 [Buttiauxella selenatireducens]|uniref:Uncharacterized protein n=1 Tax=Buttiauxella selenatireducens TaxID=3073902 RepID=A0ABY9SAX1_9ENTR|nr:hypothetical protein [Buttiauxella sp. R73]WMY74665.1 hypothetical protein RHD99_01375 [Buttiauxella sp. R73]